MSTRGSLAADTICNIAQVIVVCMAFYGHTWAHTLLCAIVIMVAVLAIVVIGLGGLSEMRGKRSDQPFWYKAGSLSSDIATIGYFASIGSVVMTCFALMIFVLTAYGFTNDKELRDAASARL